MQKEYLYVGHYVDVHGTYVLKIGTTNNLERRRKEHTRNYRRNEDYKMPRSTEFEFDFVLPLSKYNTLRYEDKNRSHWIDENIGKFVRNDRFICENKPDFVKITIRKTYKIPLT